MPKSPYDYLVGANKRFETVEDFLAAARDRQAQMRGRLRGAGGALKWKNPSPEAPSRVQIARDVRRRHSMRTREIEKMPTATFGDRERQRLERIRTDYEFNTHFPALGKEDKTKLAKLEEVYGIRHEGFGAMRRGMQTREGHDIRSRLMAYRQEQKQKPLTQEERDMLEMGVPAHLIRPAQHSPMLERFLKNQGIVDFGDKGETGGGEVHVVAHEREGGTEHVRSYTRSKPHFGSTDCSSGSCKVKKK